MKAFNRVMGREEPARVISAIAPDVSELVDWSHAPAVLAAAEIYREAAESAAGLGRALGEWQEKASVLGQTGPDADLDEAEMRVRKLTRELRWASAAEDKARRDHDSARAAARQEVVEVMFRLLGTAQRQLYERLQATHEGNLALTRIIARGAELGLNLGRIFEQTVTVINGEYVRRWRANCDWLHHAKKPAVDTAVFAEVVVRKTGGPAPIVGMNPGEYCWVPKTEIPWLLKAHAIEVIGEPENVFVPAAPPAPDLSGDVGVRIIAEDGFAVRGADRSIRWYRQGEVARINHKPAWEGAVDQLLVYEEPAEPAAEDAEAAA